MDIIDYGDADCLFLISCSHHLLSTKPSPRKGLRSFFYLATAFL